MLVLINANRLRPPIAPIGLEYVASAAARAGIPTEIVDLNWVEGEVGPALEQLRELDVRLVGISLRNVDDCFWPSATSFIPQYAELIRQVRKSTVAPIVLGGVGFSTCARQLVQQLGVEFGIHGDGEHSMVELYRSVDDPARWPSIGGLIHQQREHQLANLAAFGELPSEAPRRDLVDNRRYFRFGGQIGLETKRGCPRKCIYCADPIAKGTRVRCKAPETVVDECEALLAQGIDTLHICDGEFNIPRSHALAVCNVLVQRGLGTRLRYYTYMAVRPFDYELALAMRRSGCVGIDFTGDSASNDILLGYRAAHRKSHLDQAVRLCRSVGIPCMVDLLLGGPGETPETLRETIDSMKQLAPDCVGAGLGMRLYPGTLATQMLGGEAGLADRAGVLRRYTGAIDLTQPTFYVSPALGERPARLVRELIGGDSRFFAPLDALDTRHDDHNYSDNSALVDAIGAGARGAYWDILRRMRME